MTGQSADTVPVNQTGTQVELVFFNLVFRPGVVNKQLWFFAGIGHTCIRSGGGRCTSDKALIVDTPVREDECAGRYLCVHDNPGATKSQVSTPCAIGSIGAVNQMALYILGVRIILCCRSPELVPHDEANILTGEFECERLVAVINSWFGGCCCCGSSCWLSNEV